MKRLKLWLLTTFFKEFYWNSVNTLASYEQCKKDLRLAESNFNFEVEERKKTNFLIAEYASGGQLRKITDKMLSAEKAFARKSLELHLVQESSQTLRKENEELLERINQLVNPKPVLNSGEVEVLEND